jgi:DtxR family Mn-dependent transcriptional regulator
MQTLSEENYLKTIYKLGQLGSSKVSVKAIADGLGNNPASVIDMLKKLTEKSLITYQKSSGAQLTKNGAYAALQIVRKHRLWEVFLKDKLDYSWAEVHEIAEQLEHIKHEDLADRLDKFLGFPEYDPHGDPIPNASGKLPNESKMTLSETLLGHQCRVVAVKDTSSDFLKYLQQLSIEIGTQLQILEKISFDSSLIIKIGNEVKATVSKKFAESLLVV